MTKAKVSKDETEVGDLAEDDILGKSNTSRGETPLGEKDCSPQATTQQQSQADGPKIIGRFVCYGPPLPMFPDRPAEDSGAAQVIEAPPLDRSKSVFTTDSVSASRSVTELDVTLARGNQRAVVAVWLSGLAVVLLLWYKVIGVIVSGDENAVAALKEALGFLHFSSGKTTVFCVGLLGTFVVLLCCVAIVHWGLRVDLSGGLENKRQQKKKRKKERLAGH